MKNKNLIIIFVALFIFVNYKIFACDNCYAGKCVTPVILSDKNKRAEILRAIEFDSLTNRPKGITDSYLSPNGLFKIFYTTTGVHKVENIDKNQNGVPDYVDSVAYYFEYAYNYYVEERFWRSPLQKNENNEIIPYEVYLWDLGHSGKPYDEDYYGEGALYGFTIPINEIFPRRKYARHSSYIIIDNDFSTKDSIYSQDPLKRPRPSYFTTGIEALKATSAHEFHHAIQFMYGVDLYSFAMMAEMTSTAFEKIVHYDSRDFLQYLPALLSKLDTFIFGINDADYAYAYSIFGHYIQKQYGDTVMKRQWELIFDGIGGYRALDSAFREQGSSLEEAWCDFKQWVYFTASRYDFADENSRFVLGREFPELSFYIEEEFSSPSIIHSHTLKSYEIRACRFYFQGFNGKTNDTLDIILANTDLTSAGVHGNITKNYTIMISETNEPGSQKLQNLPYYLTLDFPQGDICPTYFIYYGDFTEQIDYAYPNPLNPEDDNYLFFPAPETAMLGDKAFLRIYDNTLHLLMELQSIIGVDNQKRVVRLDDVKNFRSGTYIYSLEYNDKVVLGKFAVITGPR